MKREKSPAYQWYPKDYNSDEAVIAMTLEEEGAYRRLMDHCWLEGSVPSDMPTLAALCKGVTARKMERMWPKMAAKFHTHPSERGRLVHPRIEKERQKQAEYSAKQAEAGRKSGKARRARTNVEPPFNDRSDLVGTKTNSSFASAVDPSIEGSVVQQPTGGRADFTVLRGGRHAS